MTKYDIIFDRANEVNRIHRNAFWISSATLFGLAVLTVIARIILKIRHRLKFEVDDYIAFFATACLITGTGVLYVEIDNLYIGPTLNRHPELIPIFGAENIPKIFDNGMLHQHVFFTLLWTAIFGVKFSFLAFFWRMLGRMKGMRMYWWVTFATLIPSWAIIVSLSFVLCPRFGADAVYCLKNPRYEVYNAMMGAGGALNATTDLMIVSIPIIILHRVLVPLRQKIIIGAFLCLSTTMIIMTIVRSAKIHGPGGLIDIRWAVYWVHIEASVAVIMVSLTSFRTAFNLNRTRTESRDRMLKPSTYLQRGKVHGGDIELQSPGATMGSYRKMGKQGSGDSTVILSREGVSTPNSQNDYHLDEGVKLGVGFDTRIGSTPSVEMEPKRYPVAGVI